MWHYIFQDVLDLALEQYLGIEGGKIGTEYLHLSSSSELGLLSQMELRYPHYKPLQEL